MDLIFNPYGEFRCEVRRAQLAISTLLTSMMVPLGSFNICSDAKDEWGAKSNGKLPHLVKLQAAPEFVAWAAHQVT